MRKEILLTAFAALLMQPLVAQEKKSPSFDEVLTTRRSIRSYDATKKISEQEVRTLMEAVQEAPSWANRKNQPVLPRHKQLDDVVKFYYISYYEKNSLYQPVCNHLSSGGICTAQHSHSKKYPTGFDTPERPGYLGRPENKDVLYDGYGWHDVALLRSEAMGRTIPCDGI